MDLSLSVRQSVSQSGRFHSNDSLEFLDFCYQGSFFVLLKTDGAGFLKTNFLAKNGVEMLHLSVTMLRQPAC